MASSCWHCGWRNPARLSVCELCGKTLGAAPKAKLEGESLRSRVDVTNRSEERPGRRTVQNPRFREVMNQAMLLVQGGGQPQQVLEALAAFWGPLQQFVDTELPAILHSTRADRDELQALAVEGERLLRSGVSQLQSLMDGWSAQPQPSGMAQRLLDIQNGLDLLGQCRDLDQAAQ